MQLKVGDDDGYGHKISKILGQSGPVCVYITEDDQLRWNYGKQDDPLPDKYRPTMNAFDAHMHDIQAIPNGDRKRSLYMLLGKLLFDGLTSEKPGAPALRFRKLENKVRVELDKVIAHAASVSTRNLPKLFDIAIICALHDPELDAVLRIGTWSSLNFEEGDPQTYHSATWATNRDKQLRVVAAAPNHMGPVAAAALAAKVIWRFRPRIVCMVGIAAGSKSDDQEFGDILVPDHTFDYGSGKTSSENGTLRILHNPNPLQTNSKLLGRLKEWKRRGSELDEIKRSFGGTTPKSSLQIHIGPLFSSPTVMSTSEPIKEVMGHWRKLVGVEMEAHAVHRAANDTIDPPPIYLCMKSVCDFADRKDDVWQRYAAFTSATLLHKFVVEEWATIAEEVSG
ncbi:hypothetical protein WQE_34596 [Paraburkholderia hospita]|uniref:Nucleoside phosphorylase domain-containing protein n=1 Tax=Paraburkholderia hospita TaxID=169430 RepID=A0ABN0FCL3_9BURK|nr:hypothetical protein [Paraburkholderia hospita]EIM96394.1 hypothetical protein WQE_34596 [Paraburkholderia hospita]OUL70244.1 hypothetical protein CA602_48375 [Paraburkholderia hospita]